MTEIKKEIKSEPQESPIKEEQKQKISEKGSEFASSLSAMIMSSFGEEITALKTDLAKTKGIAEETRVSIIKRIENIELRALELSKEVDSKIATKFPEEFEKRYGKTIVELGQKKEEMNKLYGETIAELNQKKEDLTKLYYAFQGEVKADINKLSDKLKSIGKILAG